ncbi:hypothetical protein HPB47_027966 [Ixodes persulcatus]|uniref:Uncharacterized protein n=1 Tax=Ixodes persulcatus TaxID=34615 RepID=A0AC60PVZ3_IXOPE|nr:hypothetical protein HPB47_027966 [Ixodes persulcatus]
MHGVFFCPELDESTRLLRHFENQSAHPYHRTSIFRHVIPTSAFPPRTQAWGEAMKGIERRAGSLQRTVSRAKSPRTARDERSPRAPPEIALGRRWALREGTGRLFRTRYRRTRDSGHAHVAAGARTPRTLVPSFHPSPADVPWS